MHRLQQNRLMNDRAVDTLHTSKRGLKIRQWSAHELRSGRAALLVKSRQIWFAAALALITTCPPEGQSLAGDNLPKPIFVYTRCSLPNVTPEILPRLRCGTVGVPRDHANPADGRFNLAVVVAKSAIQPSSPDPVVYIS